MGRGGEPAGAGPQEAAGSGTGMGYAPTRGWVCLSQRVPQQRAACVEPGVAMRIDGHALLSAVRDAPEKVRCSGCGQVCTAAHGCGTVQAEATRLYSAGLEHRSRIIPRV